jgi:rhomboid family GlyGly-CTERM serine protease
LSADRRAAAQRSRLSMWAWVATASAMAFGAMVVYLTDPAAVTPSVTRTPRWLDTIDWQPTLAASEPWRAWSAVFVHYSALHLLANLAGAFGVAALGWAARVPMRCVIAWLVAWPLVQIGLLVQPDLQHYGGLSGVLHAGVMVVATHLALSDQRAQRRVGTAIVAGVLVKLLTESPWAGAISQPAGWDIAVAPGAHVSGVLVGGLAAALAQGLRRADT